MAVSHTEELVPPPPQKLRNRHQRQLKNFLLEDVNANLFALSWLENRGVEAQRLNHFAFWGWLDDGHEIQSVALNISNRLLVLDTRHPEYSQAFGHFLRKHRTRFRHIVSRRSQVEPFWETYAQGDATFAVQARLIQHQRLYQLLPEQFSVPGCSLSGVRRVQLDELDPIFLASVKMHREETLEDPLEKNAASFRRHVRYRIENGRTFGWFDDHRRLLFKADVSTRCAQGAQISGVYTAPQVRNQGIATRAMRDLCALLFHEGLPRLTLYVNQTNGAARRVYQKIGFEFVAPYETIFVAD